MGLGGSAVGAGPPGREDGGEGTEHRYALRGQAGSSRAGLQGKARAEDFRMKEDRKPKVLL